MTYHTLMTSTLPTVIGMGVVSRSTETMFGRRKRSKTSKTSKGRKSVRTSSVRRVMKPKLRVTRKSYTRSDGTLVKGSTYNTMDRGAKGRAPKSKRWYRPSVHTGWSKDLSQKARVAKVVRAHKGDLLASARALQALANVTTDPTTARLAGADAKVLYKRYGK